MEGRLGCERRRISGCAGSAAGVVDPGLDRHLGRFRRPGIALGVLGVVIIEDGLALPGDLAIAAVEDADRRSRWNAAASGS
jgi:hypothetical protein